MIEINKCLFPSYHLGNGLVVCELEADGLPSNDKIAFIHPNRTVDFKKKLPKEVKNYIINLALIDDRNISATQDTKVFNESPTKATFLENHNYHVYFTKAGYSGVLSNGNIVDRRIYPNAIPMQENRMFGIPKPRPL